MCFARFFAPEFPGNAGKFGQCFPTLLRHDAGFHAIGVKPALRHLPQTIVDSFGRVVADARNDIGESGKGHPAPLEVLRVVETAAINNCARTTRGAKRVGIFGAFVFMATVAHFSLLASSSMREQTCLLCLASGVCFLRTPYPSPAEQCPSVWDIGAARNVGSVVSQRAADQLARTVSIKAAKDLGAVR